jgi:hypothetical protein
MEEAADCLIAFLRPDEEDPDAELVGALLVAEFLATVRDFLKR